MPTRGSEHKPISKLIKMLLLFRLLSLRVAFKFNFEKSKYKIDGSNIKRSCMSTVNLCGGKLGYMVYNKVSPTKITIRTNMYIKLDLFMFIMRCPPEYKTS